MVVRVDAERLRQVIANLAAQRAVAGSTPSLRVARNRAFATLEVADDGPGFHPAWRTGVPPVRPRRPRPHPARIRGGLGLSIVRAIVVAHGGNVAAHNGLPLGAPS